MDVHALCFTALYGIAFIYLVYLLYAVSHEKVEKNPTVIPTQSWWPWSITSYNQWPHWTGWYSSGGDGGYSKPSTLDYIGHTADESRPWGTTGRGTNHAAPNATHK